MKALGSGEVMSLLSQNSLIRKKSLCVIFLITSTACSSIQNKDGNPAADNSGSESAVSHSMQSSLEELSDGGLWDGKFKKRRPHGFGTYRWPSGTIYVGYFREGLRHGHGTETWPNGGKYTGQFVENRRSKGTYFWPHGDKWIGEFKNEVPHGSGIYYWADGSVYEGEMQKGQKHGWGKYTYSNGMTYTGIFENGEVKAKKSAENFSKIDWLEKTRDPFANVKDRDEKNASLIKMTNVSYKCVFDTYSSDPYLSGTEAELLINVKFQTIYLTYDRKVQPGITIWRSVRKSGRFIYGENSIPDDGSKFEIDMQSGIARFERGKITNKNLKTIKLLCEK